MNFSVPSTLAPPAPHDRLSRASPEEYHTGFVPVFDRLQEARQVLAAGYIQLRGVRVHNLKSVDLDLPHRKLIVFCGVSGSGKTSLALDTLYAEGQRRYIESFSAYTRQFLEQLEKPEAESIESIPPAIAVTRKGTTRSNRATTSAATSPIAGHSHASCWSNVGRWSTSCASREPS